MDILGLDLPAIPGLTGRSIGVSLSVTLIHLFLVKGYRLMLPFLRQNTLFLRRRSGRVLIVFLIATVSGLLVYRSGLFPLSKPSGNRLAGELSPYLQLHAHNPVDWYPWGPEALERAQREQKPIFLSIGYATCHWCHVMERLVFSDPSIAALMNANFINIKVDREERPDLDELFMTATQLLSGQGGWPNSVFLTPDGKPFYAGTYFPPTDQPGRPGFPGLLKALSASWTNRRSLAVEQAERVTAAIRAIQDSAFVSDDTTALGDSLVVTAVERLKARFDAAHGGFGGAPKFPPVAQLELLLTWYRQSADSAALTIVTQTLDAMAFGGLQDQIGGGFHRYATDANWRMPHFEKPLYTQSDMARVYLLAYEITKRPLYRQIAEATLAFVTREMRDVDGSFYSALDAETDGIEGQYYLWTEVAIRKTLGADAEEFFREFGLAPLMEGDGQVLYRRTTAAGSLPSDVLSDRFSGLLARLGEHRSRRKRPFADTKRIAAWNAGMIDTYAYAARVTGVSGYREIASTAMNTLLTRLWDGVTLTRVFRDDRVGWDGFQEDYAYTLQAMLRLYEVTGDQRWLTQATQIADRMTKSFWDDRRGGFFFTNGEETVLVRAKYPYDGAQVSGNAMAVLALSTLSNFTGRVDYREQADRTLHAFATAIRRQPGRFTGLILALAGRGNKTDLDSP